MMSRLRIIVLSLLVAGVGYSQKIEWDTLRSDIGYHADAMVNASLDRHRLKAHDLMVHSLDDFLSRQGSYAISLDSIPWLSVVKGKDFRFVTWQLRVTNEEYKYGGFMQWADRIVHFRDTRPFINGSAYTTYSPAVWYGALYYHIVPFERDGQTYYILLGFNAENSLVNTKVADVLDLSGSEPRLGVPVFTGKGEAMTRVMMTYADASAAHMRHDPQLGGIVHDHLENLPGVGPNGEALPVSDGSLDAWILRGGNWVYEPKVYDVQLTTPPMTDERKNRKEEKDILGRPQGGR